MDQNEPKKFEWIELDHMKQSGPNGQNRTKWEQGGPNKNEWIE